MHLLLQVQNVQLSVLLGGAMFYQTVQNIKKGQEEK